MVRDAASRLLTMRVGGRTCRCNGSHMLQLIWRVRNPVGRPGALRNR